MIVNQIIAALLNSLWQTAAIAALVALIFRFARNFNAATRHAVWWAVLAATILLPILVLTRTPEPARAPLVTTVSPVPLPLPAPAPNAAIHQPHQVRPGALPAILLSTWLLLSTLLLTRLAWSAFRLRRVIKGCTPPPPDAVSRLDHWRAAKPVTLLVSREIASPLACGFRNARVILPEGLLAQVSQPELDYILLHELAHLARHDQWTNLLARIAGAILAPHPVAIWILRRIERERELACDEWVVAATGAPRPYAATLARLFELCRGRRRQLLATAMAEKSSRLGERIETLVTARYSARPGTSRLRLASGIAILLLCLAAGASVPAWIAFAQSPARTNAAPIQPGPPRANSLLAALVDTGYGDLSVDDIISVKNHGIGASYIRELQQSGWGRLTVPQLIEIHARGVQPEFLKSLRTAGFENLTVQDAINLRAHGVPAAYPAEIHSLGFGPYSAGQIVDLHTHGVRPELFRALRENGIANPNPSELIEAHNAGLGAGNLLHARQFSSSLDLRQIIRLKRAGVL